MLDDRSRLQHWNIVTLLVFPSGAYNSTIGVRHQQSAPPIWTQAATYTSQLKTGHQFVMFIHTTPQVSRPPLASRTPSTCWPISRLPPNCYTRSATYLSKRYQLFIRIIPQYTFEKHSSISGSIAESNSTWNVSSQFIGGYTLY